MVYHVIVLGAIFILRNDIEVGGWSRKWRFSLTLCSENVLLLYVVKMSLHRWVIQKSLKTPLRYIKIAPYFIQECIYSLFSLF